MRQRNYWQRSTEVDCYHNDNDHYCETTQTQTTTATSIVSTKDECTKVPSPLHFCIRITLESVIINTYNTILSETKRCTLLQYQTRTQTQKRTICATCSRSYCVNKENHNVIDTSCSMYYFKLKKVLVAVSMLLEYICNAILIIWPFNFIQSFVITNTTTNKDTSKTTTTTRTTTNKDHANVIYPNRIPTRRRNTSMSLCFFKNMLIFWLSSLLLLSLSLRLPIPVLSPSFGVVVVTAMKTEQQSCALPCRNSGRCIKGKEHVLSGNMYGTTTTTTTTSDIKSSLAAASATVGTKITTDYCSCPEGYTGAYCEIKYLPCPNLQTKICDNGSQCATSYTDYGSSTSNTNNKYYHCYCDIDNSDMSTTYARQFCQKISTVFCSITDEQRTVKDDYRKSLGTTGSSFCYNGGQCIEPNAVTIGTTTKRTSKSSSSSSHHAGCICPKGWFGNHCEKPDPAVNTQYNKQPHNPDPLFLRDHLKNLQDMHYKNEQYKKQQATSRSFLSYILSFVVTFLLIFTCIGVVFWMYINYFQHQMILSTNGQTTATNNILNSVIILSNNSGRGVSKSTSSSSSSRRSRGSNGSRGSGRSTNKSKKSSVTAAERARIPQRTRSNNSIYSNNSNNKNNTNNTSYSDLGVDHGYNSSSDVSVSSRQRKHHSRSNSSWRKGHHGNNPNLPVSEIEIT